MVSYLYIQKKSSKVGIKNSLHQENQIVIGPEKCIKLYTLFSPMNFIKELIKVCTAVSIIEFTLMRVICI